MRRGRSKGRGAAALLVALGVLGASSIYASQPVASAASACPDGATLNVVAHEDDDLLFLSPDLIHDVRSGRCVRTVFVTAGDGGGGVDRWTSREAGVRAAYARMAGVADGWATADAGIPGHPAPLVTLDGAPRVSVVFLRLPDGWMDGSGTAANGYESLQKLLEGPLGSVRALDGSSVYTRLELTGGLTTLMRTFRPDTIRTQDFAGRFGDGDHSDHHAVAYLTDEAQRSYDGPHALIGYEGYGIQSRADNVSEPDLSAKREIFFAYLAHDSSPCGSPPDCSGNRYGKFLTRQYAVSGSRPGAAAGPADLRVVMTADRAAVQTGGTIRWTIRVDDANGAAAVNAWVDIALPPGVDVVEAKADRGPGCAVRGQGDVHCNLDWLSADAPMGNVILVTRMGRQGTARLTATTGADGGDAAALDNTTTVTVPVGAPGSAQPFAPPVAPLYLALVPGSVWCGRDADGTVRIGAAVAVGEPTRMRVVVRDPRTGRRVSIVEGSRLGGTSSTVPAESLATEIPRAASVGLDLRVNRAGATRPCALIVHVAARGQGHLGRLRFPLRVRTVSAKTLERG